MMLIAFSLLKCFTIKPSVLLGIKVKISDGIFEIVDIARSVDGIEAPVGTGAVKFNYAVQMSIQMGLLFFIEATR